MKPLSLFLLLLIAGCGEHEKPFTIIDKVPNQPNGIYYEYETKNGIVEHFYDYREYSIGDTIR